MIRSREIRLKTFPKGKMTQDNFELATVSVALPAEGEVLVRNLWLSVEAGMRVMMFESDIKEITDAVPGFHIGKPIHSFAIGQIIESRHAGFPKGSYVMGVFNWQEYFTASGAGMRIVDPTLVPVQYYLGVMGLLGAPAYFGLLDVGKITAGETVVVSTAAGMVGLVACQVAKLMGCRVVGITGSDEKVDWLVNELGIAAAINYKKVANLQDAIEATCPEGIDVYFDNVAGKILEAAINLMKVHGRILACGTTQEYDGGASAWPANFLKIIQKRISVLGFSILDYLERMPEYQAQMSLWIDEGKIRPRETVYEGIENAVAAWIGLLEGRNIGKMLVKLGDPDKVG